MSDQVPSSSSVPRIDGANLFNVPGGAGIVSINADITAAQLLTVVGPAAWSIPVAGTQQLALTEFAGAGVPGFVPDPGAAAPTDYLAADGTWQPIALPMGITDINGDFTFNQLLAVTGPAAWSIPVAGTQMLTLNEFAGAGAEGFVPDPGPAGPTDYLAADATWQPIPSLTPITEPAVKRIHAGTQTVTNAGGYLVDFSTTDFAQGPAFTLNPTNITIPNTADFAANELYLCTFIGRAQQNSGGQWPFGCEIKVNGITKSTANGEYPSWDPGTGDASFEFSRDSFTLATLIRLSPTDILTVKCSPSDVGNIQIFDVEVTLVRIGKAGGGGVTLQGSTPGTADVGNINVSGALISKKHYDVLTPKPITSGVAADIFEIGMTANNSALAYSVIYKISFADGTNAAIHCGQVSGAAYRNGAGAISASTPAEDNETNHNTSGSNTTDVFTATPGVNKITIGLTSVKGSAVGVPTLAEIEYIVVLNGSYSAFTPL